MENEANSFHVEFPDFSCSLLKKLNQQRQRGQLCDLIVCLGVHQFRAHRAVLAASSPYFCDQVLLKNSARVVLPDVMHPSVFERLLLSCYTGALSVPSSEVVAFLTAASFLQMWHVVDKCTELLEIGKTGSAHFEQDISPKEDGYYIDGEERREFEGIIRTGGQRDEIGVEELLEDGVSIPALGPGTSQSASCSPHEKSSSDSGEPDAAENEHLRPAYVPPSIMGLRKKVHIKSERQSREDCGAFFGNEAHTASDSDQLRHTAEVMQECLEGKLVTHLEESLDEDSSYEEPQDFYGTSTGRFSQDGDEDCPVVSKDLQTDGSAGVVMDEQNSSQESGDTKEQTTHSGFASVVYKLYPCQCGKSFTHKSQRDRHMSMHLGLRPFGCAVCGKSFKMKHHLVGHMKIHTGIKPYECNLCSKRFMWRDSFNRHTSTCARAQQARRNREEHSS
ncbi:zinc finger and BTB domain-containing protein 43 [Electrophorus electricus]|uniref:Zinc finger and BTB domain containing 43 n=1 Tax=Electrophorus electricus TaxID=8005 RepID=A0A4W4GUI2_ELEEL|nr:zinc finger and BTB domain-containing protein 43 [Electrophorus electricus]